MPKLLIRSVLVLVALVLLLAAAGVALSWAPERPAAALAPGWAPPPSPFVELQGMRVHLRDEGPRERLSTPQKVPIGSGWRPILAAADDAEGPAARRGGRQRAQPLP